jgi:6-bladed beta-propeller
MTERCRRRNRSSSPSRILSSVLPLMVGILVRFAVFPREIDAHQEALYAVEELRIGAIDGPKALTLIRSIVTSGERVFISQGQEYKVRIFNQAGDALGEFGRRGQGPGEFSSIRRLSLIDGELVVADDRARRASYYDLSGRLLGTQARPSPRAPAPFAFIGFMLPSIDRSFVLPGTTAARIAYDYPLRPVVHSDSSGVILRSLPDREFGDLQLTITAGSSVTVMLKPLHNGTRYDVSPNGLFYAWLNLTEQGVAIGRVNLKTGGIDSVHIGVPRIPVPENFVERIASEYFGSMEVLRGSMTYASFLRQLELPKRMVPVDILRVMGDGSVWFSEPDFDATRRVWHVVDPASGRHQVVEMPPRVEVLFRSEDEVWGRVYDEFGVNFAVRLRLLPGESN